MPLVIVLNSVIVNITLRHVVLLPVMEHATIKRTSHVSRIGIVHLEAGCDAQGTEFSFISHYKDMLCARIHEQNANCPS
jgi:hypothetical protein